MSWLIEKRTEKLLRGQYIVYLCIFAAIICILFFYIIHIFTQAGPLTIVPASKNALIDFSLRITGSFTATLVGFSFVWFFIVRPNLFDDLKDKNFEDNSADVILMEDLIESRAAVEIGALEEFTSNLLLSIEEYSTSKHVAYLTTQACEYYLRSEVQSVWKSDRGDRKRIIVLLGDEDSKKVYDAKLQVLLDFFESHSQYKLLKDSDLVNNMDFKFLAKDFGLFYTNDSTKIPFRTYISYIPRGSNLRFTKSPSTNYRIEDPNFCKKLDLVFNKVWEDKNIDQTSQALINSFTKKQT